MLPAQGKIDRAMSLGCQDCFFNLLGIQAYRLVTLRGLKALKDIRPLSKDLKTLADNEQTLGFFFKGVCLKI